MRVRVRKSCRAIFVWAPSRLESRARARARKRKRTFTRNGRQHQVRLRCATQQQESRRGAQARSNSFHTHTSIAPSTLGDSSAPNPSPSGAFRKAFPLRSPVCSRYYAYVDTKPKHHRTARVCVAALSALPQTPFSASASSDSKRSKMKAISKAFTPYHNALLGESLYDMMRRATTRELAQPDDRINQQVRAFCGGVKP